MAARTPIRCERCGRFSDVKSFVEVTTPNLNAHVAFIRKGGVGWALICDPCVKPIVDAIHERLACSLAEVERSECADGR